jgi:FKBP-type peptidyl-prolyl cis-trans isomerase FkpA
MRIAYLIITVTLAFSTSVMAQSALENGQRFLKENAEKQGVKTTPSGLQYKVLREGSGKSPKATDVVVVNYRGTLTNGKEFDSSYKAGQPIEFPLDRVIPGWTEGVQLMKEGAKYEFFIPSNLAYGSRGAGGVIGPDETLRGRVAQGEVVGWPAGTADNG